MRRCSDSRTSTILVCLICLIYFILCIHGDTGKSLCMAFKLYAVFLHNTWVGTSVKCVFRGNSPIKLIYNSRICAWPWPQIEFFIYFFVLYFSQEVLPKSMNADSPVCDMIEHIIEVEVSVSSSCNQWVDAVVAMHSTKINTLKKIGVNVGLHIFSCLFLMWISIYTFGNIISVTLYSERKCVNSFWRFQIWTFRYFFVLTSSLQVIVFLVTYFAT